MSYKVIIAGSRLFDDYDKLKQHCNHYLKDKEDIVVVSGHARGADMLGEQYAEEKGHPVEVYPAQWDKYGNSAGYIRNEEMAEVADGLIAFKCANAENKGTKHMINIAKRKGLEVFVVD